MVINHPRWTFQTKLWVSLILLAFFVYLLTRFHAVITPLVLAAILAFVLSPIVDFLQKHTRLHRGVIILFCYLILIGILAAIPIVITPILGRESDDINLDFQKTVNQARTVLGHQYQIAGQTIDGNALLTQFAGSLQGFLQPILGRTLSLVMDIITSIIWLVFIFVVSFYLVKDSNRLREWLTNLPPPAYRQDFIQLSSEINQIWGAFFRGQLLLALIVACIFIVIGYILGIPFALAMGTLAGLLEFIPSIGHGIWLTIASILAFTLGSTWLPLQNWFFMLIIIGLHLIYQQFDLNYLIPRVIGRRVRLPPLVVILGIVAGAALAGVLGVVLAAPTIASARVIGRYIYANLFDLDPFPGSMATPLPPPNPRWWQRTKKDCEAV